jgi:hypothetical protein
MSLTKVKNVLDITADTVADLANVQHKTGSIQLLGFHTTGDGGGGVFYWDASKNKSEHNGGTIIDPSIAGLVANWEYTQNLYFSPAVIGQGCWVREYSGAVNVKWFGAKGDGVSDDTAALKASFVNHSCVYLPLAIYGSQYIEFVLTSALQIEADGAEIKLLNDDERLLRVNNTTLGGDLKITGVKFNGNQFGSNTEDGGLVQLNNLKKSTLIDCEITGFKNTHGHMADGIATTGGGVTHLVRLKGSDCSSQIVYSQTAKTYIEDIEISESLNHGIAFVNGDIVINGGRINTVNGYGILTYSTESYKSKGFSIVATNLDLSNNQKAFEIACRNQTDGNSVTNVYLKNIKALDCVSENILGSSTTNATDGYALRNVIVEDLDSNVGIRLYNTQNVKLTGLKNSINFYNNNDLVTISDYTFNGSGVATNYNSPFIFRNGNSTSRLLIKNALLNEHYFMFYGEGSNTVTDYIFVKDVIENSSVRYNEALNGNLYSKIGLPYGTNSGREMAKQSWSTKDYTFTLVSDTNKVLRWNGTNTLDLLGAIV